MPGLPDEPAVVILPLDAFVDTFPVAVTSVTEDSPFTRSVTALTMVTGLSVVVVTLWSAIILPFLNKKKIVTVNVLQGIQSY